MSVLSLLPEDKRKDLRKESLESVYSSNSRLNLLNKRKRLHPLNPLTDMSSQSVRSKSGDRFVTQRVLSAKTHRVKQLQNQLSDAHYHLQELSNENRVLRAVQKKQEIALQRYENSNAELPQVLNSHSEEIRVQQTKYKQLKQQFKELSQKMKERDMQYQMLKDEHQHLVELTKDRNLQEREKLQAQVSDLTIKVQQQNEMITMLHRRIALEAKNFKHQLQNEINKHKDTRADLDMAINNADKLSTIIEMKEKMLSTAASRGVKSPTKHQPMSNMNSARPLSKGRTQDNNTARTERNYGNDERSYMDQTMLVKHCENSRNINSALSHDEDTSSSMETRSRYTRSRTNSNSISTQRSSVSRKNSKSSDDNNMMELAKTIQEGMADLSIFDDDLSRNASPEEMQKKMEAMKAELMLKIKNPEEQKKPSALRRMSTEESIEEQVDENEKVEGEERPKSRGRKNSTVSFYSNVNVEETTSHVTVHDFKSGDELELMRPKRENSTLDRRLSSGKPLDKYCKDIIQDIEKSSKVIDKHVKQFNNSRFENDKIVQQLQKVDMINELVNGKGDAEVMSELNNNFKLLTEQMYNELPTARKRSISSRRNSKEFRNNLLGDSSLSNQDLLNDLLGKK